MEYVPGTSLASKGYADFYQRFDIAEHILLALKTLHKRGLFHDNLTPNKILVTWEISLSHL